MKSRQAPLIAILIALAFCWSGCRKSEKPIVAGPPPTGPVELKLKWPANRYLIQDVDVKQSIETFVPSMPNPIKQDVSMGQKFSLSVLKEQPDGGHEIELEFLSARMAMGGNPNMTFDTTKKSNSTNVLAQSLQRLN